MSLHSRVMHNASRDCKRLLHNDAFYSRRMSDPASRLRTARLRAGYATAKEAAEALGFPVSTYLGHENGSRGYPASKAFTYARKFKVSEQWLLYGTGKAPGAEGEKNAEIINIIERLPPLKKDAAIAMLKGLANGE